MKLAVSGKGGVGKSTICAALAVMLAERGRRVLAVDADPDANLAHALGMPAALRSQLRPIAAQAELIEARTGARAGSFGQLFSLTPTVSDIADRYGCRWRGLSLLVMGFAGRGGGGCACPESALLRELIRELVLRRDEDVVMDMEAGVEHLGRGTAEGVDLMAIVAEPGQRAVDCALAVERMCRELGLTRIAFLGNNVENAQDDEFLRASFAGREYLGAMRRSERLREADRDGACARDYLEPDGERLLERLMEFAQKEEKR